MSIVLRLKTPDLIHEVRIINIMLILPKRESEAWRKYVFSYCRLSASNQTFGTSRFILFLKWMYPGPFTNPHIKNSWVFHGSGTIKERAQASQSRHCPEYIRYHSSGNFLLCQGWPLWCCWIVGSSRELNQVLGAGGVRGWGVATPKPWAGFAFQ